MAMTRYTDEPGSPAWHARRARCFNAGDASAMLGCHPSGKTRTQLLQELHTGLEREFSDYVQEKVINPGHRVEALWRPIAEAILGEDLQVFGASVDVGLSRPLGASLDAATFMEDTLGECKSANDALRAALPHVGRDSHALNDARQLPKGYRVQMEQQQLVTGAARTLFSACQFDADSNVIEERHAFYTSDPELRAEILAGWKQFDVDLAAYVPQAAEPPRPTGRIRESLPALIIEAKGEITASNLDAYKAQAITVIGEIPVPAKGATDQAFADGKEDGKYCRDIQDRAERAIAQLTSRMGGVHDAIQALEFIAETARRKAIDVENAVAAEEKRRKEQMQIDAAAALREHVAALNSRLGGAYMPAAAAVADFAAAVKSKRSVENMQDAVDTTLAKAKSAASETADRIQVNLKTVDSVAPEHAALFPDRATIVLKAPEDLQALVRARVAEHDAAVKRRAEEAAERERARIRAEEEARAREQARQEQAAREAEERRARAAAEAAQRQEAAALERRQREEIAARAEQERQQDAPAIATYRTVPAAGGGGFFAPEPLATALEQHQGAPAAAGPSVIPMPTRAPAATATPPTLKLGEINSRIGLGKWSEEDLRTLGFPAASRERNACMYHEADFKPILAAIAQHMVAVANGQKAAA